MAGEPVADINLRVNVVPGKVDISEVKRAIDYLHGEVTNASGEKKVDVPEGPQRAERRAAIAGAASGEALREHILDIQKAIQSLPTADVSDFGRKLTAAVNSFRKISDELDAELAPLSKADYRRAALGIGGIAQNAGRAQQIHQEALEAINAPGAEVTGKGILAMEEETRRKEEIYKRVRLAEEIRRREGRAATPEEVMGADDPDLTGRARISRKTRLGSERQDEYLSATPADTKEIADGQAALQLLNNEIKTAAVAAGELGAALGGNSALQAQLRLQGLVELERTTEHAQVLGQLANAQRKLADRVTLEAAGVPTANLTDQQIAAHAVNEKARAAAARQNAALAENAPGLGARVDASADLKVGQQQLTNSINEQVQQSDAGLAALVKARQIQDERNTKLQASALGLPSDASAEQVADAKRRAAMQSSTDALNRRVGFDVALTLDAEQAKLVSANATAEQRLLNDEIIAELAKQRGFSKQQTLAVEARLRGVSVQDLPAAKAADKKQAALDKFSPDADADAIDLARARRAADERRRAAAPDAYPGRGGRGGGGGEPPSLLDNLFDRAANAAQFAVGGGAVFAIARLLTEASKAQVAFANLKEQLNTMGQGNQFELVSEQVKAISRDTGVAAEAVAELSGRFIGAFGDVTRGMGEAATAAKFMKITGQDAAATANELVPIVKTFGVTTQEAVDVALAAQAKYGQGSDQFAKFFSSFAPIAKEAGLGLKDMAVIGGIASNALGQSIDKVASDIDKTLPAIGKSALKIAALLDLSPRTRSLTDGFLAQINQGDLGGALKYLLANMGALDASQKQYLTTILGSKAQFATWVALINNAGQATRDFANEENDLAGTGALDRHMQSLSETITNMIDRMKASAASLAESFSRAGLTDVFQGMATGIGILLAPLQLVATIMEKISGISLFGLNAGGNLLGPLLQGVAAFATLAAAVKLLTNAKERLVGANTAVAETETLETTSHEINTVVEGEEAATTGRLAGVKGFIRKGIGSAGPGGLLGGGGGTAAAGAAEGEGAAAGSGLLGASVGGVPLIPGVAIALIAASIVHGKSEETEANLKPQAEEFAKQVEKADVEKLKAWQAAHNSGFDKFTSFLDDKVLRWDPSRIPDLAVQSAITNKEFEGSAAVTDRLVETQNIGQFARQLDAGQLEQLGEAAAKSQRAREIATDLGAGQEKRIPGSTHQNDLTLTLPTDDKLPEFFKRVTADYRKSVAEGHTDETLGAILKINKDILDNGGNEADVRDAINNWYRVKAENETKARVSSDIGAVTQTQKLFEYEKGGRTLGQHMVDLQFQATRTQAELEGARQAGNDQKIEEYTPQAEQAFKAVADAANTYLLGQIATMRKLSELGGTGTSATDELTRTLALIADQTAARPSYEKPAGGQLTSEQIATQVNRLPDLLKGQFAQELANEPNPIARAQKAEAGRTVSKEDQKAYRRAQVMGSVQISTLLAPLIQAITDSGVKITDADAKLLIIQKMDGGTSLNEAVKQVADDLAKKYLNPETAGYATLSTAFGVNVTDASQALPDTIFADDTPQTRAINTIHQNYAKAKADLQAKGVNVRGPIGLARQAQAEAWLAYAEENAKTTSVLGDISDPTALRNARTAAEKSDRVLNDTIQEATDKSILGNALLDAGDDPIAQNKARLTDAYKRQLEAFLNGDNEAGGKLDLVNQEIRALQAQGIKNAIALASAAADVQGAKDERDPVKSAQDALQKAKDAEQAAKDTHAGKAAEDQAEAARIRAEHHAQDAISDNITAKYNVAIAIANASGDVVEAARIAAEDAHRKLDEALARGEDPNGTLVRNLTQNAIGADANHVSAVITAREETIDFMQQMGQITISQAIDQYKLLLTTVQEGTKAYRDLQLKIHSLEQTAQQDYQYNLPSSIALPTLYEARRLNQSYQMGIGYQDNRNINLDIKVNGTSNPNAVAAEIVNAFRSASGQSNQISAGVGSIG